MSVQGEHFVLQCVPSCWIHNPRASPIINTLPLSINTMKQDRGELAKPTLLTQRPPPSKPTPSMLRSCRKLRKKMPGVGILGVSCSLPQARRFGWLLFKPHWHVLSLSNCQSDAPAGRPPAMCRSATQLRWWWRWWWSPSWPPQALEVTSVFQGNRSC